MFVGSIQKIQYPISMNNDEENAADINLINEKVLQLSEKIQQTNPSIKSFLDETFILPALRCKPLGIKEYKKAHLLELLSVCLSPDLSLQTTRAYYAFCFQENPIFYKPILDNRFFPSVVDVILQNVNQKITQNIELDEAETALLGRISTITYNSIFICPRESMNVIHFIPQLLDFCYISSVSSLFEKLLSNISKLEEVQDWLTQTIEIGNLIANKIINNYTNRPNSNTNVHTPKPSVEDSTSQKDVFIIERIDNHSMNIAALYNLIAYGCMGIITRSHFRSDLAISAVCQTNTADAQIIRNYRWKAAVCLCHSSTAKRLLSMVDMALAVLYIPVKQLTNEVVQCINFLTLMLQYLFVETSNLLLRPSSQIFPIIIRIVLQFPSSSIIHNSFRTFVTNCISNSLLMPKVIETYVPLLLAEVQNRNELLWKAKTNENQEIDESNNDSLFIQIRENRQNGIFYATCWQILIKIAELSGYSGRSTSFFSPLKNSTPTKNIKASASSPSFLSRFSPKRFKKDKIEDNNSEINIAESPKPTKQISKAQTTVKAASIRAELDKIVGFDTFVKTELQEYIQLLNSPYGGPVPMTSSLVY